MWKSVNKSVGGLPRRGDQSMTGPDRLLRLHTVAVGALRHKTPQDFVDFGDFEMIVDFEIRDGPDGSD
jgi:hypothetical protein